MFKQLFDFSVKELKKYSKIAKKITAIEDEYRELSDSELQSKTDIFKKRFNDGETLEDLLVEAYATVREASRRVTKMVPFYVQILGAICIHEGNIAEMKTGEGKTLTAVMPAYLNALSSKGVHIVTVNEYLAAREVEGEIGELFRWLGLSVGLNMRELSKEEKRAAYECDILYTTNNEVGFDYLRDHMVIYKEQIVQRPLNFAIIDEVDSILVDEARTPLIISGGQKNTHNLYQQASMFVRGLRKEDFELDIKTKNISLLDSAMTKAERAFNIDNLYDVSNVVLLHHINNAMKAYYTMERDVDYVVQDNQVIIVDQFTGRLMHGRQFSEGLHQALEAKENVEIKKETSTLATITFQNLFRMYNKLSGMTGTAKTEEEEFINIYNMYVVEIPTNEPIIRKDDNDLIFTTMKAKYVYLADEIARRNKLGQPILVGTISIETSELLSTLLKKRGIKHDVLNAKQHEREAEIVENAGQIGVVTIATNMAGRGTDIKLADGVVKLGGLCVLGTERHESRRIDNQLRGRSGRQGDPGYTRFFISAEDELLQRFGGERLKKRLEMLTRIKGSDAEHPIDYKMFSRFVKGAQTQIEGNNFDRRKTVLKYDEVLRKQREIIYKQRRDILFLDNVEDIVNSMIDDSIKSLVYSNIDHESGENKVNDVTLYKQLNGQYYKNKQIDKNKLSADPEEVVSYLKEIAVIEINEKKEKHSDQFQEFLKVIVLRNVDTYWMRHIDSMSSLKQSISLQQYAQKNPLIEYQDSGFRMFEDMITSINQDVTRYALRAQLRDNLQREQVAKATSTHSGKEDANRKRKPIKKDTKIGRNDPCSCGSGKKYKNCCGR